MNKIDSIKKKMYPNKLELLKNLKDYTKNRVQKAFNRAAK